MKARASFRSQLLGGSIFWTIGLLCALSAALIAFLGHHPKPHMFVLNVFNTLPLLVSLSIGAGLMAAGVWQIRRSFRALGQLQTRLAAVHRGEGRELAGRYPAEVQALVDDLNELLAEREQRVHRALARAGDLAHGLKTPLAVLASDADRLAASGDPELAASLSAQVERMRQQIEYHLAQARAAAASQGPAVRAVVAPSVEALIRTLQHLHAERALTLHASVPEALAVRCQREDLEEILGNVLDNACKWGRSRVQVEAVGAEGGVTIAVDDDGPGLDPALASEVLRRGVRADERVPGSGLGLSIAHDLLELYRGTIELSRSPLGGLRVTIRMPSPDVENP